MCNLSGLIEENAIKKANVDKIKNMIQLGLTKEFILKIGYTKEEYIAAETELCQLA